VKKLITILGAAGLLPALLLTAAAPAGAQAVEGVAAIVNDEVISTYDVRQRMRLILASTGIRPTEELLLRIQEQALNTLIDERLQLQQAEEFEITVDQAEIDSAMADLAEQNNVSSDEIRAELARAGVDPTTLEDQLRAEIAWQIMVNGRYRPRVRVSNDQINQMLERIAESSSKPSYLISEILIEPTAEETRDETLARVQAIVDQLATGEFPAIARQFSAAASAIDGGDVSWVRSGEIKPEIEARLVTMQPGTISQPIETQDGFYIIALRETQSAVDPERVTLQQISAPVPAGGDVAEVERALIRAARGYEGCEDLSRISDRAPEVTIADLGSMAPSELAQNYRDAVAALRPGELSAPMQSGGGVVMLALCARDRISGDELPSREQVENRLLDQQLTQAGRRWLRDLRRDATIETRVGP
jgi:peptidyl-prolyl cis-trans isomerase SurA